MFRSTSLHTRGYSTDLFQELAASHFFRLDQSRT
jgi:hypothetical protein